MQGTWYLPPIMASGNKQLNKEILDTSISILNILLNTNSLSSPNKAGGSCPSPSLKWV